MHVTLNALGFSAKRTSVDIVYELLRSIYMCDVVAFFCKICLNTMRMLCSTIEPCRPLSGLPKDCYNVAQVCVFFSS